jgi:thiol-disulfide isomerase/thioredoxin
VSPRGLLGVIAAISVGVIVFLVVEISTRTPDACAETGKCDKPPPVAVKVEGAKPCTAASPDCRPKLTFIDTNGEAYPTDVLDGKVVVVNFWATWCHPCQEEIPSFSKVFTRYKGKGVVMLGVMTDDPDPATLLNFESDHELLYPVVRVDRDILNAFRYPDAIPTTFVYDPSGHLRASHRGPMSAAALSTVLDQILADS